MVGLLDENDCNFRQIKKYIKGKWHEVGTLSQKVHEVCRIMFTSIYLKPLLILTTLKVGLFLTLILDIIINPRIQPQVHFRIYSPIDWICTHDTGFATWIQQKRYIWLYTKSQNPSVELLTRLPRRAKRVGRLVFKSGTGIGDSQIAAIQCQ